MMQHAPKHRRFWMEARVCYAFAALSFILALGGIAYDFAIREAIFAILWSILLVIGGTGVFAFGRQLDRA
jgi:hypothetical protein